MKKIFFKSLLYLLLPFALYAQPNVESNIQSQNQQAQAAQNVQSADTTIQGSAIAQLDMEHQKMASQIYQKLRELPSGSRIRIGNFLFENSSTPMNAYWKNQLLTYLLSQNNRNFIIIGDTDAQADYLLDGEFIIIANNLRVFAKLMKLQDSSLLASWGLDLTSLIRESLLPNPSQPYNPPSSSSMDNPIRLEIDREIDVSLQENGENWFIIAAQNSDILVFETTGHTDTYMELYDSEGNMLAEDDDSGTSTNARIFWWVQAGRRYLIRITGYDGAGGAYRFSVSNFSINEIELGVPQERIFENASDIHQFVFNITEESYYEIKTVAKDKELDTFIQLYDESLELIDEDDDSGGEFDAYLNVPLKTGRYILLVSVIGDNFSNGAYTIRVSPYVATIPENIQKIEIGTSYQRAFEREKDIHWFSFNVEAAGIYEIRSVAADKRLDTYIKLHNEKLIVVAEDDDSGEAYDAYINKVLERGTYYIRVHIVNFLENNAYALSVISYKTSSIDEPIKIEIKGENFNSSISRYLDEDGEDWFSIFVEKDGFLLLETTGRIDTCMKLYDYNSKDLLAEDDDSGKGSNARIMVFVQGGTTYLVNVYGFDGATGVYNFNVNFAIPYEFEISVPQEKFFSSASDAHIFKFTVTEGTYEIRTRAVDRELDTYIELYNEDFVLITEDDDSGEAYDAYLEVSLENGWYYLLIRVWNTDPLANGSYTLSITHQ